MNYRKIKQKNARINKKSILLDFLKVILIMAALLPFMWLS